MMMISTKPLLGMIFVHFPVNAHGEVIMDFYGNVKECSYLIFEEGAGLFQKVILQ